MVRIVSGGGVDPVDFSMRVRVGPTVIVQEPKGRVGDGAGADDTPEMEEVEAAHATIEVNGVLVWAGQFGEQSLVADVQRIASELIVNGEVNTPV